MAIHTKVNEILANDNLALSDCYQNPDVFNSVLEKLFGNVHLIVVEKIRGTFSWIL